jgi:hypothetical protein
MSLGAWSFLAVICVLWLAPIPAYIHVLRKSNGNLSSRVRIFVALRIWELVLFVVILAASVLTTRWFLIGEIVPLGVLPLCRRSLKRREFAAG